MGIHAKEHLKKIVDLQSGYLTATILLDRNALFPWAMTPSGLIHRSKNIRGPNLHDPGVTE